MIVMKSRPAFILAVLGAMLGGGLANAQSGTSALKGHDSKAPIDLAALRGP
jgi:hypothetical protein